MLACCACAAPRASCAFHTGHSTPHAQRQAQRTTLIITPFEAIVNQNRKRTYTTTYGGRVGWRGGGIQQRAAPQGSRRPRGGCHRGLGHMHCDSAGPWQASASRRLRKGCPGAMSSTRTTQIWRGASIGRAVRVGCASVRPPSVMLPCPPACTSLVSCLQKTPRKFSGNAPQMSLQKLSQNRPPCLSVGSRPRYH